MLVYIYHLIICHTHIRVCLIYLAETHSIIQQNKDINAVEFCCITSDPVDYKVSGKAKNKYLKES